MWRGWVPGEARVLMLRTEATDQPLVTGDLRMYNAVREHLDWVKWIGDYQEAG